MLRKLLTPSPIPPAPSAINQPLPPLSREDRAALGHFPREPLSTMATKAQCWPFPAHLDNPNCKWLRALKHVYAQPITFPASLSPQAGLLLHAIVLNVRPRMIIETGTFLGISTIWMAAALELAGAEGAGGIGAKGGMGVGAGGHIHCIDDFRPIKPGRWREAEMLAGRDQMVRQHLDMARLSHRVTLHNAGSAAGIAEVAKMLRAKGDADGGGRSKEGGVQLAFLDADHTPAGVRAEFTALEPILDTGGYIILHDIYPEVSRWKGPRELLDNVHAWSSARYEHVDLYLAPANFGLGVMRRIG